ARGGSRRRPDGQQDHRRGRDLVGAAVRREAPRPAAAPAQRGAGRAAGSVRIDFTQQENALARALARRKTPYVDLTLSNPTQAGLPALAVALPAAPAYEPHPRGLPSACEAVAAYHGVSPDRVVLTASTSEGYAWLFKLLCDAGDEVLVPEPSYPLFGYLTALEGVRAAPYGLRWDGEWHLDTAALQFSTRTRAVVVVSPGNPTGAYLKEEEREALAAACNEHGCALICDEVFADFPAFDDPRRAQSAVRYGDVLSFSLSGLSKVACLPRSRSEEEWALALLEAGVLVHPGYFFDFPSGSHLVLSLLPEPAAFSQGSAMLSKVLSA